MGPTCPISSFPWERVESLPQPWPRALELVLDRARWEAQPPSTLDSAQGFPVKWEDRPKPKQVGSTPSPWKHALPSVPQRDLLTTNMWVGSRACPPLCSCVSVFACVRGWLGFPRLCLCVHFPTCPWGSCAHLRVALCACRWVCEISQAGDWTG